jgi:hypothetical protein
MLQITVSRRQLVVFAAVVALVVSVAWVGAATRASAASSTPVVYVATGENFPDALGASAAAAVQGGPVLLVTRTSIPAETKAELNRLKPDVIYVAGGTMVVSDTVFNALKNYAGSVVRVAGGNRYATAAEVSKSAFPVTSSGGGDLTALTAAVNALTTRVDALEADNAALTGRVETLELGNTILAGDIAVFEATFGGVHRDGDTLVFEGMNLQVVNGEGSTNTSNSLGNVFIGYNWRSSPSLIRTGSHYLIIGDAHTYTGYSGIVAGYYNTVDGDRSSVLGGQDNIARGTRATVVGGNANTASAYGSTVVGGYDNTASGQFASILGGNARGVSGTYGTYPFCGCGS